MKRSKSDVVEEICYCYKGNFPGKNIRKDDEEKNLYVLTDEQEVSVFLDFESNDFRKKIGVFEENISTINDFRPLESDKLLLMGSKGEIVIHRFNKFSSKKLTEFYIDQIEPKNHPLEAACVVICPRSTFVVVSAHNFYNGSKRRLYLLNINEEYQINLLTIKQYQNTEPERNSYITMNLDFYINDQPLLLCYENSSSGQVIAYIIKNNRFEVFQIFDRFMSHYCYFSTVYSNNIWSIDNSGKIRCLQIVKENELFKEENNLEMRSSNFEEIDSEEEVSEAEFYSEEEQSFVESDLENNLTTPYTTYNDFSKKGSVQRESMQVMDFDEKSKNLQNEEEEEYMDRDSRKSSSEISNFHKKRRYRMSLMSETEMYTEDYNDMKKEEGLDDREKFKKKEKILIQNPFSAENSSQEEFIQVRENIQGPEIITPQSRIKYTPRDEFEYEETPRNQRNNNMNESEVSDYFNDESVEEKVDFKNVQDRRSRGLSFVNQSVFNDIDTPIAQMRNTFTYEQEKVNGERKSINSFKYGREQKIYKTKEKKLTGQKRPDNQDTIQKTYLKKDGSEFIQIQNSNESKVPLEYSPHELSSQLLTPEARQKYESKERENRLRELRQPSTLTAQRLKQEREEVMKDMNFKKFQKMQMRKASEKSSRVLTDEERINRTARGIRAEDHTSALGRRKEEDFEKDHTLFKKKPAKEVYKEAEITKLDIQNRFKSKFINSQYVPPVMLSTNRESKRKTDKAVEETKENRLMNFNSFQNQNLFKPETKLRNCFRSPMIYKTGLSSGK